MTAAEICQRLQTGLSELFQCSDNGEYTRVRTPYLYPDGDNIDLFLRTKDGVVTVSDLGETTRWLRMQTVAERRSPKQRMLIQDACVTHGVEFYKGMLQARCRVDEDLSAVFMRVA